MHVDYTNKYRMIMGWEIIQKIGLYIKFSDCTIRGKTTGHFKGCYTSMKYFQEVVDTNINDEIIYD